MAKIIVRAGTFLFASASKTGCIDVSYDGDVELVEQSVDGVLYDSEPAVRFKSYIVRARFVHYDVLTSFVSGAVGALSFVGKEGTGGSDSSYAFANAMVESVSTSTDGSAGTVTFRVYSSDGTTDPLSVT